MNELCPILRMNFDNKTPSFAFVSISVEKSNPALCVNFQKQCDYHSSNLDIDQVNFLMCAREIPGKDILKIDGFSTINDDSQITPFDLSNEVSSDMESGFTQPPPKKLKMRKVQKPHFEEVLSDKTLFPEEDIVKDFLLKVLNDPDYKNTCFITDQILIQRLFKYYTAIVKPDDVSNIAKCYRVLEFNNGIRFIDLEVFLGLDVPTSKVVHFPNGINFRKNYNLKVKPPLEMWLDSSETDEIQKVKTHQYEALPLNWCFEKAMKDHHFSKIKTWKELVQKVNKFSFDIMEDLTVTTDLKIENFSNSFKFGSYNQYLYYLLQESALVEKNIYSVKDNPLCANVR